MAHAHAHGDSCTVRGRHPVGTYEALAASHGFEAMSEDPTSTKSLRQKYAQKLRAAYAEIITAINKAVRERDVLNISAEALVTPPRNFDFKHDDKKADAFGDWLEDALDESVLTTIGKDENPYIESAQLRGLKDAQRDMTRAGYDIPIEDPDNLLSLPVYSEKAQLLYSRNYRELEGINRAVGNQISQELTQGLAEGRGVPEMARALTDRVDKIGRTRATTLAHTEVIYAHAEGKLDTYERLGVEEVLGHVEISTAGDRRVCDVCEGLVGQKMTIDEARGLIPVHPRCRCTWKPVRAG